MSKTWKFYFAVWCPLCVKEVCETESKTGAMCALGEHFAEQHQAKIVRINRGYDSKGNLLYDKSKVGASR